MPFLSLHHVVVFKGNGRRGIADANPVVDMTLTDIFFPLHPLLEDKGSES